MFLKILRDIAKPQWFEIIIHLKQSTGMSVAELSNALGMSYMGIKQHCVELEKRGYLDTWRRPKKVGRPEKAYRLTHKADLFFPQLGNDFALGILNSLSNMQGEAAAEKILFGYFKERTDYYKKKVKGENSQELAASLAKMRHSEGYLSEFSQADGSGATGCRIVEYHTPFGDLAGKYPILLRMEEQMFERILDAPVKRIEERASALVRFVFNVG
jgi:predicted ArsR family transcriptional regulator